MNDYIQKYGQNAIQAYKKSLRVSESLQKNIQSPSKEHVHMLPKKTLSKKQLKSSLLKKNQSLTKLAHSKSIRNLSKNDDEGRKKSGSFVQLNKKNQLPFSSKLQSQSNGFSHTFNKIGANKQVSKKLTLNQTPTSKNTSPKLYLNIGSKQQIIQDKLTQRIHHNPHHSSSKKHQTNCSTSQSKYQANRQFLTNAESVLQNVLNLAGSTKKITLQKLSTSINEVFQIILGGQTQCKWRKLFILMRQAVYKISNIGQKYKQKLTKANNKINTLQRIHNSYMQKGINQSQLSSHYHSKSKSKLQNDKQSYSNRKKSSIQTIIMNQNYELRKKINRLVKQLDYYTSQEASLMNVFGKYKNSESQLRIGRENIIENFDSMKKGSNNKLQNRRSSQNLYNYHQNDQIFSNYGVQKRLSFDPNVLHSDNDNQLKKKSVSNFYQTNGSSLNAHKSSLNYYESQHPPRRNDKNQNLQQLSEEEDSQYQE